MAYKDAMGKESNLRVRSTISLYTDKKRNYNGAHNRFVISIQK